ncbi:MAG: DNA alkylation repair protein [Blastocatellia bacterium]|nr:DNA alkylation repair protein [Blastocatellia bacterium]
MNPTEALQTLESLGTEQNRKVYRNHGVAGELYGVSFANLEKLRKKIKINHPLALGLWASGNHDARILATMIADPAQATDELLEAWAASLTNYAQADAFSKYVVQTAAVRTMLEQWTGSDNDWIGQTGWSLLSLLARTEDSLPDDFFLSYLSVIETTIHTRKNRTRHAMNMAVVAIGVRNSNLQDRAIATARKIGKVKVDHGDTACKTPDAESYILKTVARKKG